MLLGRNLPLFPSFHDVHLIHPTVPFFLPLVEHSDAEYHRLYHAPSLDVSKIKFWGGGKGREIIDGLPGGCCVVATIVVMMLLWIDIVNSLLYKLMHNLCGNGLTLVTKLQSYKWGIYATCSCFLKINWKLWLLLKHYFILASLCPTAAAVAVLMCWYIDFWYKSLSFVLSLQVLLICL